LYWDVGAVDIDGGNGATADPLAAEDLGGMELEDFPVNAESSRCEIGLEADVTRGDAAGTGESASTDQDEEERERMEGEEWERGLPQPAIRQGEYSPTFERPQLDGHPKITWDPCAGWPCDSNGHWLPTSTPERILPALASPNQPFYPFQSKDSFLWATTLTNRKFSNADVMEWLDHMEESSDPPRRLFKDRDEILALIEKINYGTCKIIYGTCYASLCHCD